MSEMERNPEVPASTRDEASFIPAGMPEVSQGASRNIKGDLTSLWRHERVPQVDTPFKWKPKLPANFHATQEIFLCTLEEAILRCIVSKESPRSLLELERVLDML